MDAKSSPRRRKTFFTGDELRAVLPLANMDKPATGPTGAPDPVDYGRGVSVPLRADSDPMIRQGA